MHVVRPQAIIVAYFMYSVSLPAQDPIRSAAILSEASRQAEHRRSISSKGVQYTISDEYYNLIDNRRQVVYSRISRMLTGRDSDSMLVENINNIKNGSASDYVICINRKYCFQLNKNASGNSWLLSKLHVTDDPEVDTKTIGFDIPYAYRRPSRQFVGQSQAISLKVYGYLRDEIDILSLTKLPGVAIVSQGEEASGNYQIEFRHELPSVQKVEGPVRPTTKALITTKILLNPEHEYLPVQLHQTLNAHGELHEYEKAWKYEFADNLPVRTICRSRTKVYSGQKILADSEQIEQTDAKFGPIPEVNFTLTAFGFPEPPGIEWGRRGLPLYGWALIVGLTCVAILIVLRYFRRSPA